MSSIRKKFTRLLLMVLAALFLLSQHGSVYAYDLQFYAGNDVLHFNPESCDPIPESGSPSSDIGISGSAEQNLRSLLEFLTGHGMTLAGAAGVAGNIKAESGFEPAIIQGGTLADAAQKDANGNVVLNTMYKPVDGVGFGLAQWTYGGTVGPRQGPLYQLAKNSKRDIIALDVQLEYLWKELNTGYKVSTLDKIIDSNDVREATKIVMVNFESPADKSEAAQEARADMGEAIYNKYRSEISGGSGEATQAENTSDESGCSWGDGSGNDDGGIGSIDGFTFPLKTTKAKIRKGVDGAVWNSETQSCYHHDYCAADIFAETGTPILAAAAGKVVNTRTAPCTASSSGCNVTIMGDDGVLYYYTHMHKSPSVDVGQKVGAGDQIGAVGTNQTAMGTPRHLHIDMLPGDQYSSRPSCSGSGCSSLPFLNVQELAIRAFRSLPEGE